MELPLSNQMAILLNSFHMKELSHFEDAVHWILECQKIAAPQEMNHCKKLELVV